MEPKWSNATVLKGEVGKEVSTLKNEINGEIIVYASYQLVHTLIEHDLVDEFRLVVFPVVLGAGTRLFGESSNKRPLRLVCAETIGEGLVFVTYEVARAV
jgi:dihydrofolate reductase